MNLVKKNMAEYKAATKPLFSVPERVQELIPIRSIAKDGIFCLEDRPDGEAVQFDKAYLFLDTNFATMDDFEKTDFLKQYCSLLNSLNVTFKIIVMNNNRNMEEVRQSIFLKNADTRFSDMIRSFNKHIEDALTKGRSGIEQVRLFILSVRRQDVEEARSYFRSIEASIAVNFKQLQSGLIPLDAQERLKYLYGFYHFGNEDYSFDFDRTFLRRADWKDFILPRMIRYSENERGAMDGETLQIDDIFVRAFYLPKLPNAVDPLTVTKLTAGAWHVILTCDVTAIPDDVARKRLTDLYMQNGRAIEKQQQIRNNARAWSSDITYERRREREELESYMDILNDNDEKMFYLGIYAVLSAKSREQLEHDCVAFLSTAEGEGFSFEPARYEQNEAVNTALPTGARLLTVMQPVFTQPLSAFTPFNVHELYDKGGIFYGINQLSKNVLIGDRKKLHNGNGFVLGITGGGKGMDAKQEMMQVFLKGEDDIITIDPMNEYKDIADYVGGQFIDFSSESGHYINPLDIDTLAYLPSVKAFIADKTELMLGVFSQVSDHEITAQDKSLIGRCVNRIYEPLQQGKNMRTPPTLVDFYEVMGRQPEPQAYQLQFALELFVKGALDLFAHKSNVNRKGRFTVYGLSGLGREQAGIGTLIMLEGIRSRIAENAKRGRATWLYVDEFHNLSREEFSAGYLDKIWKEVRKLGGLCTGITQNIADILRTKTVETMLCNSEYISLLKQSDIEIAIFSEILGLSDNMLDYVHNVPPGCGLLKFGNKYIPKDNRLPKESTMYQLFNTNFHEIQAQAKKRTIVKEVRNLPDMVQAVIQEEPTRQELIY